MSFSKKIILAILAYLSPFFSGCSDSHKQDLVSDLSDTPVDRRLVNIGETNPKTLYIKQKKTFSMADISSKKDSENIVKVSSLYLIIDKLKSEVQELKILDDNRSKLLSKKELQFKKLLAQKENQKKELEHKNIELHKKIERLTKQNNKEKFISNEKIATLTVALSSAKKLTEKSTLEVKHLEKKLIDLEKKPLQKMDVHNDIEANILKE